MNIWDIIICVALVCALVFAAVTCVKRKKRGGCCGCSSGDCCEHCKK